mgnify:FL=1
MLDHVPFDLFNLEIPPRALYPIKLSAKQIKTCLIIIEYFCDITSTDTDLFNAISKYNPRPHHPLFHNRSDFHGKLMAVYYIWLEAVHKQYAIEQRKRTRSTASVPMSISPQDFWLCCAQARVVYFDHGDPFEKTKAMFPLPSKVAKIIFGLGLGGGHVRRNVWVDRWKRSGESIRHRNNILIVPEEMETFFYEIASKEMIVAWEMTSFFDVTTFTTNILKKTYTNTFKLWFRNLFEDPNASSVKSLVDNSVALMVQKITNTKLKAIRVYHKAQELKGGVKFRDQRRVEAGIQVKKFKEELKKGTQ